MTKGPRRITKVAHEGERMKVAQLKEKLAARGSTRTGLKMVLQRRLHGMLVHAARAHEMEE